MCGKMASWAPSLLSLAPLRVPGGPGVEQRRAFLASDAQVASRVRGSPHTRRGGGTRVCGGREANAQKWMEPVLCAIPGWWWGSGGWWGGMAQRVARPDTTTTTTLLLPRRVVGEPCTRDSTAGVSLRWWRLLLRRLCVRSRPLRRTATATATLRPLPLRAPGSEGACRAQLPVLCVDLD